MYLVPVISEGIPGLARLRARFLPRASALLLAASAAAAAQDFQERAGTAEFQFIETLAFARPAGMAGAFTALAQGVDAVGYNPAGVARDERVRTVAGTFRYHFLEVASGNATYAYPGHGALRYAFSAAYVNYGRIHELDEEGEASGRDMVPASFNPSLTMGGKVGDQLRLGASLRGFSEYLGDFEGSELAVGWGVDAGLQYQPSVRNLGFGLALLNLGRKETPHYLGGTKGGLLPVSLKAGMFYYPLDLPKAKVAFDLEAPWHGAPRLSGGVEYALSPAFTLRGGTRVDWAEVKYGIDNATGGSPGDFRGGDALKLAGGFTFAADDIAVDYAVQYWHGLSWVHALTLKHAVL